MKELFSKIEQTTPKLSDWCPLEKAYTLACLVVAMRPKITCEVGVWRGASCIPLALAHQYIGYGKVIAIDAWDKEASTAGQLNPGDNQWWGNVNHDDAYTVFCDQVHSNGLDNYVQITKSKSDQFEPPDDIGIWHCDGNHGEQVMVDVQKFVPKMTQNGIIIMDDYHWSGGFVLQAVEWLKNEGYVELYRLGTGGVFQRG